MRHREIRMPKTLLNLAIPIVGNKGIQKYSTESERERARKRYRSRQTSDIWMNGKKA